MEQMSMFGCPTAYRSSRITRQTRRESNEKTDRQGMYSMILKELSYGDMTAREIGAILYRHGLVLSPSRQQVQPRLTELMQEGKISVVGKRKDSLTKRSVAVYHLVKQEEEE